MKIFKHNIKRILKNKVRFAFLILLPFMFITLFLFGDYNTVTIGISDSDNSQLSQYIISDIKKNSFYNVKILKSNELIMDTIDYQVDYSIHFEEGFEEEFFNKDEIKLKEYYFVENENVMNAKIYIQSIVENIIKVKNNTDTRESFFHILEKFNSGNLKVSDINDNKSKLDQAIASIGFLVYFLIFLSVVTCGVIIEDRKNGTLERIFNSPISLKRYLAESLLSFILIGLIQVSCILLIFKYILNFHYGSNFISLFILVFIFSIVSVTMGLLIVSNVKSPIQAYLLVGILASPLSMLGGCYWPIDMLPEWLQNVSQFIPTTWVMTGTHEIVMNQGGFIDIIDNIGVLILFGILFFVGGIFKRNDFAKT